MSVLSEEKIGAIERAMRAAGDEILAVRATGVLGREDKTDGSPVSEADRRADAVLVPAVAAIDPGVPVVSEERATPDEALGNARHWLLDPLDGTRSFLAGGDDFTINLGLVVEGVPLFGSMLDPVSGRYYCGGVGVPARVVDADGSVRMIRARACPDDGPTVLISSYHASAFEEQVGRITAGCRESMSSALKFCRIAEGAADVYLRPGRTMEWDTAAGHAIVAAAGGAVTEISGAALRYGKASRANPPFLAEGSPDWRRFLEPAEPKTPS